jgi:microcystin-dependent protein
MPQPYIGEIRIFAGNFAPLGWEFCDGQLVPISENDALFALIGTTYGGDGESTFALPDLRGRLPLHHHSPDFQMGQAAGVEAVTLTQNQIPSHTHPLVASTAISTQSAPAGNVVSQSAAADLYIEDIPNVNLAATAVGPRGGSQPHTNLQPFLGVSFIISLFGIFPTQT